MSVRTDVDDEVELDYATLSELRGDDDGEGPLDHPCPLCGPDRSTEYNQMRPVLRTWHSEPGFITYCCVRCEAKGYAHANGKEVLQPRPRIAVPRPVKPRANGGDLQFVEQLWKEAMPRLPAEALDYFRWRGIWLDGMPEDGVLQFHPRCPWHGERLGCVLARYSDALSGEPRGIWRRIAKSSPFDRVKPMTLGPMAGCVIRLYPKDSKRLVVAEGIENALTVSTRDLTYRGEPLRPVWATGCANKTCVGCRCSMASSSSSFSWTTIAAALARRLPRSARAAGATPAARWCG